MENHDHLFAGEIESIATLSLPSPRTAPGKFIVSASEHLIDIIGYGILPKGWRIELMPNEDWTGWIAGEATRVT